METINLWYAAGLGDILMSYSCLTWETALVQSLKERFPHTRLRAVLCTVSDSVAAVFATNPYFSEVSYHSWVDWHERVRQEQSGGFPYLAEMGDLRQSLEPRRMSFYLDDAEQESLARIEATGPFAGLHFFAGVGHRNWLGRIGQEGANRVIRLIRASGLNVVLLGAPSRRSEGGQVGQLDERIHLEVADDGVFDMIGRHTARLHAELTRRASVLVGTMSCFISLGTNFHKPSFVVLPRFLAPWFSRPDGGVFKALADNGADLNWWDDAPTLEAELQRLERFLATKW